MKLKIMGLLAVAATLLSALTSCDPSTNEPPVTYDEAIGININKQALEIATGYTGDLVANVLPETADQTVAWISSNKAVATVNRGVVTGVAPGTAIVTAVSVDGSFEAPCTVTVRKAFSLNKEQLYMGVSDTETLVAVIMPVDNPLAGEKVAWGSTNKNVATVSDAGVVTAIAAGTAEITAILSGYTAKCIVTINWIGKTGFRTERLWQVGNQTWSDAVTANGCDKEDFRGGVEGTNERFADCRKNIRDGVDYGNLFTWILVDENADQLCPGEWRVPSLEDYLMLDAQLGGMGILYEKGVVNEELHDAYRHQWGGEYGDYIYYMGIFPSNRGVRGIYWTSTAQDKTYAYTSTFWLNNGKYVQVGSPWNYSNGMPVRCVK